MPVRVFLADEHPVVRVGMQALLQPASNFRVVGEAGDGLETVRLVEQLKPDVLVLDLRIPGLNGLDAIAIIRQRSPGTRVLVLSALTEERFIFQALRNGATGYALKSCDPQQLVRGVRAVAAGRRYLSPPLSERVIAAYAERAREAPPEPHESLTPREREVFQLVAEGFTSAEIAQRLHLSQRTVENHRANVMRKLSVRNQVELLRYALKRGLIPLDS